MNRAMFYSLRHNIRASGWQWNWGSRVKDKDGLLSMIADTLLHPSYDSFEDVGSVLGVWNRAKERGHQRTKVYWQNIMRSNVRRDNRCFSEQLTSY